MRIQINLASEPFRRDRLVLVGSAALAGFLVVLLSVFLLMIAHDRQSMQTGLQALDRSQRELARITREQRKLEAELRQAGNADVLERSQFINALLYRKAISWTRLFADLEKVLPPDVRVISVRPQVDAHNQIFLDMVVGAASQKPVIDLLTKFEASDLFGSTAVFGILPPSQTDPLFRYRLTVNYAQKL